MGPKGGHGRANRAVEHRQRPQVSVLAEITHDYFAAPSGYCHQERVWTVKGPEKPRGESVSFVACITVQLLEGDEAVGDGKILQMNSDYIPRLLKQEKAVEL